MGAAARSQPPVGADRRALCLERLRRPGIAQPGDGVYLGQHNLLYYEPSEQTYGASQVIPIRNTIPAILTGDSWRSSNWPHRPRLNDQSRCCRC